MKQTLLGLLLLCCTTLFAQNSNLLRITYPIPEEWQTDSPNTRADGMMTSHWTQDYPYNMLCPRDPVNNYDYSYAGCPAIAMGQIINYLRTTNGARFDDSDDYAHNYGGRNYQIDDDWADLSFPSFPELNELLDSADAAFSRGEELTDELAAAIVFACGTACTQVYTSQSSGTFYVEQAYAAYQRFGFSNCVLYKTTDSAMYATLISNIENGYPAHLAVESPDGSAGHNVVVDGYCAEDGKFHINMGYGGYMDGWYNIPDDNFFYGLTKLEGIILNIIPTQTGIEQHQVAHTMDIYPNPARNVVFLKNTPSDGVDYEIVAVGGQKMATGRTNSTISTSNLQPGIYFIKVSGGNFSRTFKLIVK